MTCAGDEGWLPVNTCVRPIFPARRQRSAVRRGSGPKVVSPGARVTAGAWIRCPSRPAGRNLNIPPVRTECTASCWKKPGGLPVARRDVFPAFQVFANTPSRRC